MSQPTASQLNQVNSSGPAALVVGAIDRADMLAMFTRFTGRQRLTFLDYRFNYGIEIHRERYQPYGDVISWDQFGNAAQLLDRIAPRRVVFFFTSSLDQLALKLVAQRRGIITCHLEHGFRAPYQEYASFEESRRERPNRLRDLLVRSPRELACAAREHAFFWRSLPALDAATRRQAAAYALKGYWTGHSMHLRHSFSAIRRVDEYIAHAPEDFQQHWVGDGLARDNFRGVHFIGLPQFDYLCGLPKTKVDPRKVILIDHQFHNSSFHGWNLEFRRNWTARIADIVRRNGLRLLIKRHPGDVSDSWDAHLEPQVVELIDYEGLRNHIPSTGIILGNISSMQLPLAGMEHTALITLEIHPEPVMLSKSYVRAGVARAVATFEDLEKALRESDLVRQEQSPHKPAFTEQFLHSTDGLAGERLYEVITGVRPPQQWSPPEGMFDIAPRASGAELPIATPLSTSEGPLRS